MGDLHETKPDALSAYRNIKQRLSTLQYSSSTPSSVGTCCYAFDNITARQQHLISLHYVINHDACVAFYYTAFYGDGAYGDRDASNSAYFDGEIYVS